MIRFVCIFIFLLLNNYIYSFSIYEYRDEESLIFTSYGSCQLKYSIQKLRKNSGNAKIRAITLAVCSVKDIPPEIFTFKNLEYLDLGSNYIGTIPENISKLSKLKFLNLSDNKIEFLPKSIGDLVNLQSLNLSGNQLKELPEGIGQLMNLEKLDLSDNQLSILPASIVNLINMRESIAFSGNNFKTIYLKKYNAYTSIPSIYPGVYSMEEPIHFKKNLKNLEFQIENYVKGNPSIPLVYTVSASSGLSVRQAPSLKAQKIGSMPHRLKIAVYEESKNTESIDGITAPWMRIKAVANGKYMEGWAWAGYLEKFVYTD